MSFDRPDMLGFLALALPILYVHFYRERIQRHAVPSLAFWEDIVLHVERRTALQVLRHHASLFLNLSVLALLVLALSSPKIKGLTQVPRSLVLILDSTPSMGTLVDEKTTRFIRARETAKAYLHSLKRHDRIAVYDSNGPVEEATSDRRQIEGTLDRIAVRPEARPLKDLIESIRGAGLGKEIVYFSDAADPAISEVEREPGVRLVVTDQAVENLGFTDVRISRNDTDRAMGLTVRCRNYGSKPVQSTLEISLEQDRLLDVSLDIPPGETREWRQRMTASAFPGHKLEDGALVALTLKPGDAFPMDDRAFVVLPSSLPPRVVLFYPGNAPDDYLKRVVRVLAQDGVVASESFTAPIGKFGEVALKLSEEDLIFMDDISLNVSLRRGRYLFWGCKGEPLPYKAIATISPPRILEWNRSVALTRLVDVTGIVCRTSDVFGSEWPMLIQSDVGPVAIYGTQAGVSFVALGFRLSDTDMTWRPSFPIFIGNVVEWLTSGEWRWMPPQVRCGDRVRTSRPVDEPLEVFLWNGRDLSRVAAVPKGQSWTHTFPTPGIYRLKGETTDEWVAANFIDPNEADIRPKGSVPPVELPPAVRWYQDIPFTVLAAVGALVILTMEWFFFHRGWI